MKFSLRSALLFLLLSFPALAFGGGKPKPLPHHWIATWASAEVALPTASMQSGAGEWIPGAADSTIREIVHTSIPTGPSSLVRLEFTNALGTDSLTLGEVHVALADPQTGAGPHPTGDISLLTAHALTFSGTTSVTIAAGAEVVSDPMAMALPAGADLVISIFVPAQTMKTATFHPDAWQTGFVASGNVVSQRSLAMPATKFKTTGHWWFLKSVDVQNLGDTSTVVAFGDSITDGYGSTPNTNNRWPTLLAARIAAQTPSPDPKVDVAKQPHQTLAVVDEGIGGNRILREGYGPSALARFDRDVLAIPGVSSVILLEGINDIGVATGPVNPHDPVTAAELIDGLSQLAARAHAHNLKVFGATLTPYLGAGYASPAGEAIRQQVNTFIRTTPLFDGVLDFDKAIENSADPATLNPAYDHGDHLHPNDAGYQAMANAVPIELLTKERD
jgi:lysophospholipase L1-like esterase